jgi:general secretion pathway protein L
LRKPVTLPEAQYLCRTVSLPDMSRRRMAGAIALQIDALTPFQARDVRFDFRVVARDVQGKTARVAVWIAQDAAIAAAAPAGSAAARIDAADEHGAAQGLDLRSAADHARSVWPWRTIGLLAVLAIAIWIAGWSWSASADAERRTQASAERGLVPQAARAQAAKRRWDKLLAAKALSADVRAPSTPLQALGILSTAAPKSLLISRFVWTGAGFEAAGEAEQSAALLAALSTNPAVKSAAWRVPPFRNAGDMRDRFDLLVTFRAPAP